MSSFLGWFFLALSSVFLIDSGIAIVGYPEATAFARWRSRASCFAFSRAFCFCLLRSTTRWRIAALSSALSASESSSISMSSIYSCFAVATGSSWRLVGLGDCRASMNDSSGFRYCCLNAFSIRLFLVFGKRPSSADAWRFFSASFCLISSYWLLLAGPLYLNFGFVFEWLAIDYF